MAFITIEDYKKFANLTTTKTDDQLNMLIDTACNIVETYLSRKFAGAESIQRYKVGENRMKVFLRDYDQTVSEVKIRLNNVDKEEIVLSEDNGTMFLDDYLGVVEVMTTPEMPIVPNDSIVTVTASDLTEAPKDVQLATYMLVTYYKEQHYNKDVVSTSSQNVTFAPSPKNLPNYVRALLTPHRMM